MIEVNEYFNGEVKSLGYELNGKSTIGVINPGDYKFGTSTHETMKIIEGSISVLLQGEQNSWKKYVAGESFEIEANTSFKVSADSPVAYLCKYK